MPLQSVPKPVFTPSLSTGFHFSGICLPSLPSGALGVLVSHGSSREACPCVPGRQLLLRCTLPSASLPWQCWWARSCSCPGIAGEPGAAPALAVLVSQELPLPWQCWWAGAAPALAQHGSPAQMVSHGTRRPLVLLCLSPYGSCVGAGD